ncbi:MAG: signal peptidase I [Peptoniphilaceae bacterium]|nr:signal peptidase I [Peptoniphilaceae bacterium]MDY6018517.1 signal peptidase I [Anaerococcus sp.]
MDNKNDLDIEKLQDELARVNKKLKFHQSLRTTFFGLLVVAAVIILLATLYLPVLRIYGSSMTPALKEGDIVIALKNKNYDRGDIIGLYYGNKLLVKRIVAKPGEEIDFDANGNVYVDNKVLKEDYTENKAYGDVTIRLPYKVAEERYFVLGDHRDTSVDSRNKVLGALPQDQIIGKIVFRVWPLAGFGRIK